MKDICEGNLESLHPAFGRIANLLQQRTRNPPLEEGYKPPLRYGQRETSGSQDFERDEMDIMARIHKLKQFFRQNPRDEGERRSASLANESQSSLLRDKKRSEGEMVVKKHCVGDINDNDHLSSILPMREATCLAFRASNVEILLSNPAPNDSMWEGLCAEGLLEPKKNDPEGVNCGDGQNVLILGTLAIDLRGVNYDNPFVLIVGPMVIDGRVCHLRVPTIGTKPVNTTVVDSDILDLNMYRNHEEEGQKIKGDYITSAEEEASLVPMEVAMMAEDEDISAKSPTTVKEPIHCWMKSFEESPSLIGLGCTTLCRDRVRGAKTLLTFEAVGKNLRSQGYLKYTRAMPSWVHATKCRNKDGNIDLDINGHYNFNETMIRPTVIMSSSLVNYSPRLSATKDLEAQAKQERNRGIFLIVANSGVVGGQIPFLGNVESDVSNLHHEVAKSAGLGSAGQWCMALGVIVFVEGSKSWEEGLRSRIDSLIGSRVKSGARLMHDGRNVEVPNSRDRKFVNLIILVDVTNNIECYEEETFGLVLLCMVARSLEEAIDILNRNEYGNGTTMFPISGFKASFAGNLNFYGKAAVQLYTQIKTVKFQWDVILRFPAWVFHLAIATS
eukprot:Gb_39527 [translate_table: standard]